MDSLDDPIWDDDYDYTNPVVEEPVAERPIATHCCFCGSRLIEKDGQYGKFKGCPRWPECRGITQGRSGGIFIGREISHYIFLHERPSSPRSEEDEYNKKRATTRSKTKKVRSRKKR